MLNGKWKMEDGKKKAGAKVEMHAIMLSTCIHALNKKLIF